MKEGGKLVKYMLQLYTCITLRCLINIYSKNYFM